MNRTAMLTLLAAVACTNDPVSVSGTNNRQIQVDELFEHDGCKVYRFEDGYRDHYYVRCKDTQPAQTLSTESCGKNCTRPVDIQTVPR